MKNVLKVLIATLVLSTATLAQGTQIKSFEVEKPHVVSGQVTQATVRLAQPAPAGGFEVEIWSEGSAVVPTRVIVPAGRTQVTFPIQAKQVEGEVINNLAALSPHSSAQTRIAVSSNSQVVLK